MDMTFIETLINHNVVGAVNLDGLRNFLRDLSTALVGVAMAAAVVFFIIGAIQLNGSSINYSLADKGKTNMIHAVISACLAVGAVAFINIFLGGFNLQQIAL